MSEERLVPGSLAHRLLALLRAGVAETQHGATVPELRAAADGDPALQKLLGATLQSLRRRGYVAPVDGRVGHQRYAPAGWAAPPVERPPDDVERVLRALRRAVTDSGRAVTTREVAQSLEATGEQLSRNYPNAVRRALLTLAAPRRRGLQQHRGPVEARRILLSSGRPSMLWRLSDARAPWQAVPAAVSRAEVGRALVAHGQARLGRPTRREDLALLAAELPWLGRRLWLREDRIESALRDAMEVDGRYAGTAGRLHEITTAFTCHGGAMEAYTMGPPSPLDVRTIRFEDALAAARLLEEEASLQALKGMGERVLGSNLTPLVIARRMAARQMLVRALGTRRHQAVIERVAGSLGVLQPLAEAHNDRKLARRWARRVEELDLARSVLKRQAIHRGATGVATVGEFGAVDPGALARWIGAAAHAADEPLTEVRLALASCRRIPVTASRGRLRGRPGKDSASRAPLARLDRVDALVTLFRAYGPPRALMLVEGASTLLGHVLRDARLVGEVATSAPMGTWARRHAVVALGLLGTPASPSGAWDADALHTLLTATSDLPRALTAVHERYPAARAAMRPAIARARAGLLLSVLEP